ncbi:patatin-like phospholipase family protein [Siccirubricoccus deserti]
MRPRRALVLAGGVALGAFEAGAYAALEEAGAPQLDILVGVSAGAVNAAIIAGNPPGARAAALRRFWNRAGTDPTPATTFLLGPPPPAGAWRAAYNEASALQTLLLGNPLMFRPRLAPGPRIGQAPGLFDLEPLLAQLPEFVDFERLNNGACRIVMTAIDVETGERVVFDTSAGTRIGPRHVVASCALLPVFAPVELDGRLLGDGGWRPTCRSTWRWRRRRTRRRGHRGMLRWIVSSLSFSPCGQPATHARRLDGTGCRSWLRQPDAASTGRAGARAAAAGTNEVLGGTAAG